MIVVCVMTKLPIVLVGKPGTSKTLSMIITRENLTARSEVVKTLNLEPIHMLTFQCSKLTTASAIERRWEYAVEQQEQGTPICMFFDEVGLAVTKLVLINLHIILM